jgi:hypothetical protein
VDDATSLASSCSLPLSSLWLPPRLIVETADCLSHQHQNTIQRTDSALEHHFHSLEPLILAMRRVKRVYLKTPENDEPNANTRHTERRTCTKADSSFASVSNTLQSFRSSEPSWPSWLCCEVRDAQRLCCDRELLECTAMQKERPTYHDQMREPYSALFIITHNREQLRNLVAAKQTIRLRTFRHRRAGDANLHEHLALHS